MDIDPWVPEWGKKNTDAWAVFLVTVLALCAGGVVTAYTAGRSFWGYAWMWSTACTTIGAAVGFLFGIPRSSALADQTAMIQAKQAAAGAESAQSSPPTLPLGKLSSAPLNAETGQAATTATMRRSMSLQTNTNLEQISDWLTKIIVGVPLVRLQPTLQQLRSAAELIASSLGGVDRISFAYALMISFSLIGFLGAYLLTRLFLQGAFERVDHDNES